MTILSMYLTIGWIFALMHVAFFIWRGFRPKLSVLLGLFMVMIAWPVTLTGAVLLQCSPRFRAWGERKRLTELETYGEIDD